MSLFQQIKRGQGLLGKGIRGGALLMVGNGGEQGFRFLRNLILARLLAPESFGLMALVLSSCSLAQVLTAVGVREAVVQSPHGTERTYLNGVWWLSMARGVFLFVVSYLAAPFIAKFYEEPALASLLRVSFLALLMQGASSPAAYVALKEMRYPRWVCVQNLGGMFGVSTTIVLGFLIKGVWALVIGYVAESTFRVLLSHIVCPFRLGFHHDKEHWLALWRYTRGLFGLPVLTLISGEASVFVVGKLCSKEELGLFALVAALSRHPSSLFLEPVRNVLLPAFAKLQGQLTELRNALNRITMTILLPGFALVAFAACNGSEILHAVYGEPYAALGGVFAVLVLCEVLSLVNMPLVVFYLTQGKPHLQRRFALVRSVTTVALLYPMVKAFGLLGAAVAPGLGLLLGYGFQLARVKQLIDLDLRAYGLVYVRALLFALPAVAAWLLGGPLTHDLTALPATMVSTTLVVLCYSLVLIFAIRLGPVRHWLIPQSGKL